MSTFKSPFAVAVISATLTPKSVATVLSRLASFTSFCIALITKLSALCSFAFNFAFIFALFVTLASVPVYIPKMLEFTDNIFEVALISDAFVLSECLTPIKIWVWPTLSTTNPFKLSMPAVNSASIVAPAPPSAAAEIPVTDTTFVLELTLIKSESAIIFKPFDAIFPLTFSIIAFVIDFSSAVFLIYVIGATKLTIVVLKTELKSALLVALILMAPDVSIFVLPEISEIVLFVSVASATDIPTETPLTKTEVPVNSAFASEFDITLTLSAEIVEFAIFDVVSELFT